ncbi:MAG: di-trans,poly-cis-decaprenylcistransferase [Candidatus Omnitrophica bacterium]|nr:di-trans,poly-cis-decaprenylcistransferase [Candidatus Omnitrophota bacterium]
MASNLPQHIAIIMDGNGRWARRRGLPRTYGHRQGAKAVKRIVNACLELNINYLTLYTFSTENWSRPQSEVDTLMRLLGEYIDRAEEEIPRYQEVRVRVIGRYWELPGKLPEKIEALMNATRNHKGLNLTLAINYGGRREILDAVDKIIAEGKRLLGDEQRFRRYLYAPEIPDPDLLIRTAGEYRISNFLLWQISYTEIYTTKKLWPDFNKLDLIRAIKDYQKRRRKFGGV